MRNCAASCGSTCVGVTLHEAWEPRPGSLTLGRRTWCNQQGPTGEVCTSRDSLAGCGQSKRTPLARATNSQTGGRLTQGPVGTNPRTGQVLFNPLGALKCLHVGSILVFEVAGWTSSDIPTLCWRSLAWYAVHSDAAWLLTFLRFLLCCCSRHCSCLFLPCSGGTLRRTSARPRVRTLDTSLCVSLAALSVGLFVRHILLCHFLFQLVLRTIGHFCTFF